MVEMAVLGSTGLKTPLSVGEIVRACRILQGLTGDDFTVRSASGYYLILGSNDETIQLNDASNLTLSGYTNTSIVGALNEAKTDSVGLITQLASLTGASAVDLTTPGSTALYTVPAGKSAVIHSIILRVSAADTVTAAPAVQVEITGSSGDVIPSTTLVGVDATTDVFLLGPKAGGVFRIGAAADIFNLNVTSAATATSLDVEVDVMGYTF